MHNRIALTAIAIVLAILSLSLGRTALAHSSEPTSAGCGTVQSSEMAGGVYHLQTLSLGISGDSGGSGYHLSSVAALSGSGCCCNYLPLIKR